MSNGNANGGRITIRYSRRPSERGAMSQTRSKSMVEVCTNVGAGFIISYCIWLFVVPVLFDIQTRPDRGLAVTGLYTVAAILRGYIIRRFFNR